MLLRFTRLHVLLLSLVSGCARADDAASHSAPNDHPLVGTWRAAEYINPIADDSARRFPFGRPPRGYLVYDATGHVFLQAVRGLTATPAARGRWFAADSAALQQYLAGASAYFGTYEVDAAAGRVTHHIEGEIPPNRGTIEIAERFRVYGDTLMLGRDSSAHWLFIRVH
jgi:lipocalin-like protein